MPQNFSFASLKIKRFRFANYHKVGLWRPIQARFHYGSAKWLNLADKNNSLDRSTKSTPSQASRKSEKNYHVAIINDQLRSNFHT